VDPWIVGSIECERREDVPSGAVSVVRLVGEHDLTSVVEVRSALRDVADGDGLIVDLGECVFLDSSVIGALLHARRDRPAFAVVLPADPEAVVIRALHVTGVDAFLSCCASLDEARRVVAGPRQPAVDGDRDGADGADGNGS